MFKLSWLQDSESCDPNSSLGGTSMLIWKVFLKRLGLCVWPIWGNAASGELFGNLCMTPKGPRIIIHQILLNRFVDLKNPVILREPQQPKVLSFWFPDRFFCAYLQVEWLRTNDALTTFTRGCARDCKDGCRKAGVNYVVERCTSCCSKNFCNYGSGADNFRIKFSWLVASFWFSIYVFRVWCSCRFVVRNLRKRGCCALAKVPTDPSAFYARVSKSKISTTFSVVFEHFFLFP